MPLGRKTKLQLAHRVGQAGYSALLHNAYGPCRTIHANKRGESVSTNDDLKNTALPDYKNVSSHD